MCVELQTRPIRMTRLSGSSGEAARDAFDGIFRNPTEDRSPGSPRRNVVHSNPMLAERRRKNSVQNWKLVRQSVFNTERSVKGIERGVGASPSSASVRQRDYSSLSGNLHSWEYYRIRKNFLMYSLGLVSVVVVLLAGFGTLAAQESQLQTVQYLGKMLLDVVKVDLEWIIAFTEREVVSFAVNTAPLNIHGSESENATMSAEWASSVIATIFAVLESTTKTASSKISNTTKNMDILWQMYYARPDGTVLGVSKTQEADFLPQSSSLAWECWGGLGGNTVARTKSSEHCTWENVIADQHANSRSEIVYDARQRPWYTLAKSHPGSIVWTKPYTFKATGYLGITAAIATRSGHRFANLDDNFYDNVGVFAVDITLSGLEEFLALLARSVQSKDGFSSFPADIGIVYEDKSFEKVISSSMSAKTRIFQLKKTSAAEGNALSKLTSNQPQFLDLCEDTGEPPCVNSNSWIVFTDAFTGLQLPSFSTKVTVIALIRASNFLSALELASRTIYPFIAAIVMMMTVLASNSFIRQILKRRHKQSKSLSTDDEKEEESLGIDCRSRCKSMFQQVRREWDRHRYSLHPMCVCVVTTVLVHVVLSFGGNTGAISIYILNKVILGWNIQAIFMDAGFEVGFFKGSYKVALQLSSIIIVLWLTAVIIDALVRGIDGDYSGPNKSKIDVTLVVRRCFEVAMLLMHALVIVKRDSVNKPLPEAIKTRNSRYFGVSVVLVLVLGVVFQVTPITKNGALSQFHPYFFIVIASVLILMTVAHFDRTVRATWPRPKLPEYTLVLCISLLWMLPWILALTSNFTKGLNTSSKLEGYSGLRVGFVLSLGWSICSVIISVFFQYFQEPAVADGIGITIHFCFCFFRSLVGSLLFLIVEPLDIYFYVLCLVDTGAQILSGLGLRAKVWDRYCSKARWKDHVNTRTKKIVRRVMFKQFSLIPLLCSKFVMIVLCILDLIFLDFLSTTDERDVQTGKNISAMSNSIAKSSVWIPVLTGEMHRLERLAMAAGFVVQFSFQLLGNDIIQGMLTFRAEKLARKLSATHAFRSMVAGRSSSMHSINMLPSSRGLGLEPSSRNLKAASVSKTEDVVSGVLKSVSRTTGGLAEEVLLASQLGKYKYKFRKHRDAVFKVRSSAILIWSVYIVSEAILGFHVSRKQ